MRSKGLLENRLDAPGAGYGRSLAQGHGIERAAGGAGRRQVSARLPDINAPQLEVKELEAS